ncbi:MAG: superfamily helicase, partial [Thermomicrobiales bacterium]|nr:superfamily helicase [Thermomicrobiales bacterium]
MADVVATPDPPRAGVRAAQADGKELAPSAEQALFPAVADDRLPRISPTVISQFVRLDQCRRYLRLALHERVYGSRFMRDYNVAPQEILPLLTRAGAEFEERVEAAAAQRFATRKLAAESVRGERQPDNEAVSAAARDLKSGETVILFQARLRVPLDGWDVTGDADIVRFERDGAGDLHVLVADMKATTTAKIEHRLQVAFYREMLDRLLAGAGVEHGGIATGILYRGGATEGAADDAEIARIAAERDEALRLFNIDDAQLELTPDPESYVDAIRSLVMGPESVASVVATAPFADIPWHLTYKCDGCLYNEFCMQWAAEHDDLSLLPHLVETEKAALQRTGIITTRDLVALLHPVTQPETREPNLRDLKPAQGKAALVRDVSRTWPVGPRLNELVHRARRYRHWRGDPVEALPFIPSKGYGSLPYSDAEHNPNLVKVFIDAQHDYLLDRLYLIGSLVVANERGVPAVGRRRSVVAITDAPPDEESERELLVRWIEQTIRAIAEVAAPDEEGDATAPIHLIFYNQFEQKLLLQALGRHAGEILAATPLYDFITQLAAFDSPVATFLDQEIRELKNYPIVCQSLQAVAAYARPHGAWFDWNAGEPYREIFRERMFDALGRLDGDGAGGTERTPWYTRRSRFNSQIPLEYAYAAWEELPDADTGERDPYEPFRRATIPLLKGFQGRRLEALEHVAADFLGNRDTKKSNFMLPDLSSFDGKARGLVEALREFVTIERHVGLAAWKAARLAPPERRVVAGDALLVRYFEEDQTPEVAAAIRENEQRTAFYEAQKAQFFADNPDAERAAIPKEERALSKPVDVPGPIRLRLDVADTGVTLDDALALATLKVRDRAVLAPRWMQDQRLPVAERVDLTPTAKALLYRMRVDIGEIEVSRDAEGGATEAWIHVTAAPPMQSDDPPGFLFASHNETLIDGDLYSVDPDPNDLFGFWGAKVVNGLLAGGRNTLFERVRDADIEGVPWPTLAREGQARFMAGLLAMHAAGLGNAFEASKIAFIGEHGEAPLLLVQGPPGTGKSYTTAFATLARVQGAMAAGLPYRVVVGAKTHAATDVLLANLLEAQQALTRMRDRRPDIFAAYFDDRLLTIPLFRLQPREEVADGIT